MTRTLRHGDEGQEHEQQQAPAVDPVMTRLAFDVAVDQLTAPGVATITRDDGSTERGLTPCLLDQLVTACSPGGEHGGGSSGGSGTGSRPPAALNALAVVAEIGSELRTALAALGHDRTVTEARLSTQVRAWAAHAEEWQYADLDYLAYAARRAEHWVVATRGVLDPAPRRRLRGHACPVCRESTVLVWSDVEGERVRQAALSANPEHTEITCAACDTHWHVDHWEQLGALIAAQQRETLAIDCE